MKEISFGTVLLCLVVYVVGVTLPHPDESRKINAVKQFIQRVSKFADENDTAFVKTGSRAAFGKFNLVKLESVDGGNHNQAFQTNPMGRRKRSIEDEDKPMKSIKLEAADDNHNQAFQTNPMGRRKRSIEDEDKAIKSIKLEAEDGNHNQAFQKFPMGRKKRSIEDEDKAVKSIQNSHDQIAKVMGEYRLKRSFTADNDSAKFTQSARDKRKVMDEAKLLKKDSANFKHQDKNIINDNQKPFMAKDKQFVKMSKINDGSMDKIKAINCENCPTKTDAKMFKDDDKTKQVITKMHDDDLKVSGLESDRMKRHLLYADAVDGTTESTDDTKPIDRQRRHFFAVEDVAGVSGETTTELNSRRKRAINQLNEVENPHIQVSKY